MIDVQELSPDVAYAFLHGAQELDAVGSALRASGYVTLADNLLKLQADIGLQFVGNDASPSDGPQTAALLELREGNAATRMDRILRECREKLSAPALREWVTSFMAEMNVNPESAGPQSGERMTDGTVYAGSLDGRAIYATLEDAPLTCTFKGAAEYVQSLNKQKFLGHDDWRMPDERELNLLWENRDRGALKGTFNETGWDDGHQYDPGKYWSGEDNGGFIAWVQRFGDGRQDGFGKDNSASLRCVRG